MGLTERIARVFVVVACLWFAFAAAWGMFGFLGGGHSGAGQAGNAMWAENMLRWKTIYPVGEWYLPTPPSPGAYYCHHPFGIPWASAIFLILFGHRDFVVPLPAILMSAATPWLLYRIGRMHWGVVAGAAAACGFVVVPIAVGFANFHNLEVMCIFGGLLFYWGHSRYQETGLKRHLVASLTGLFVTCAGDWVGYLIAAPLVGWAFVRGFLLPRRFTPRFSFERYAKWWAFSATIAVLSLVLWVGLFHHANKIGDWLASAEMRGSAGSKLSDALEARKSWIDFSFTPFAILVGKLAAPLALLRFVVRRRDEEIYSLGILFAAIVQYVAFKRGADVHIFWPHYFAPYFGLALAQTVATFSGVSRWLVKRWSPKWAPAVAASLGILVALVPPIVMAPDAVRSLWVWRRTGGRYNDNGALIRSHIDMLFVLRNVVMPRTPRGAPIDTHPSAHWGWEHTWVYAAPNHNAHLPSHGPQASTRPFWIGRGSGMSPDVQKQVIKAGHVQIYGDVWVVDQREPAAPLDAWSLNEREPNPFEWLVYGGVEPMRSIGPAPDPLRTWEWRSHLEEQDIEPPPPREPTDIDEARLLHNAALARGDHAEAERLRELIEKQIDRTMETAFDQGMKLIGVRVTKGVQPRIEAWFEARGAAYCDATFSIRSVVERANPLSLIPPDGTEREMAWPPSFSPKLWKEGYLYKIDAVMNHRIGYERYWGYWRCRDGGRAPQRFDGRPATNLAVVL